ncbi:hypothetical protein LSCM1_01825 [Leishmania martiniquensis]|uniref:Uncharacterized protein n=1 Tax=Leishmania martiniquensis TaxID=1580590 RepID=A0A836G9C4_9TRYP|nr:hypothetical protein LSCM1_01825 [Leishmania martiniquensis]
MPNLLDEAEAECARIGERRYGPVAVELRTREFDFLTSPEMSGAPIHILEARREEHYCKGMGLRDFMKAIGIHESDIKDPVDGHSILQVDEAMRAYFGTQEEEAYRLLRKSLIPYTEDVKWLRRTPFLGDETAAERERQRYVDRNGQKARCAEMMLPPTAYKQEYLSKSMQAAL